jgi:hypothetical protein
MAFLTYQCDRYISYLRDYENNKVAIYDLIDKAPFTKTVLAEHLGWSRQLFNYKFRKQQLTTAELTQLLNFIK